MKRAEQGISWASSRKRSWCKGVSVDGHERSLRAKVLGDGARVPAAAESAVDDDLAGLRVEQAEQLLGKHRNVNGGHVKQDGQRAP